MRYFFLLSLNTNKNNMSAPFGNKNAVGNGGGCPPYYDGNKLEDIEKLSKLCIDYFEQLPNVNEPPTVTGLTLFLGFEAKSTLYEYAKKLEFSNPIKRALTKIEQFHEIATSMGDKCTGNIFILKNFGWKDTNGIELSGELKTNAPPTIMFVESDHEDD